MAALAVGREEELLVQLRAVLFLPSTAPAPASSPAAPVAVKVESAGGPLAAVIMGTGGGRRGRRPDSASSSAVATADASSCGRGPQRRRQLGSKRGRHDHDSEAKGEQHEEEPAAAQPHYSPPPCCIRRKKKKQQQGSKSIVTSVPDFDGYQWRKYGQKQIEGAMYPRSYYRCTRSTEQGCAAKRTVQRNDDGGDAAVAATPKYTVVYVAEHTCTANDSLQAPVILETTTAVAPAATDTTYTDSIVVPTTSAAGSCSTTTITTRTESPAVSISGDDVTCWSSSGTGREYNYADDDYNCGGLFAAVHAGGWTTGPAADSASLQEMEDLTGPIRSPVHIPVPACWTIDQLLLQLVNEPVCHF